MEIVLLSSSRIGVRPHVARMLRRKLDMTDRISIGQPTAGAHAAPTRRSFLTRMAGVSALAVPTLTLTTPRKARAQGSDRLTGFNAVLINEILNDEAQHVPIIQNLLDDPDNPLDTPIRQAPNFNMERLT